MLGSVFDIGTFCLAQMLIHQCVSSGSARRPLPLIANLKAFDVAYEVVVDYHPRLLVDPLTNDRDTGA
jgi:hypothetical protein